MRPLRIALLALPALMPLRGEEPAEEACQALAHRIEAGLNAGDGKPLDQALDWDALLDKALEGCPGDPAKKRGFREGVTKGGKASLSRSILEAIRESGSYKLLRIRKGDAGTSAVFRMLMSDGAVNYHEMLLPGDCRISDVHVATTGEWMSQTLRRPYLLMLAEEQKGLIEKLLLGEGDFLRSAPRIREAQRLFLSGDAAGSLRILRALPEALRKERFILNQEVAVAARLGSQEMEETLAVFEKAHPGDPALEFLLLDRYVDRKEHDRALVCVDRLDKAVGGDPHLDFLRANICYAAGRFEEAKAHARRAIEGEPTLGGPYWTLVTVSLDQKDYPETARLLTLVQEKLGVGLQDLHGVEAYAGFVESEAYREWKR